MLFRFDEEQIEIEKVKETNLATKRLKEKDLENLMANNIEAFVRADQLMVIHQERARQEEPDIMAVDADGKLYIFELKRWESKSENLLQVLRYGQKFGRYSYEKLNNLFKKYQSRNGGEQVSLIDSHQNNFELDLPIDKNDFNQEQQFIVITNGIDHDTWDAINYW